MIGDNRYLIIRRLLEGIGGIPMAGDMETDLLEKYLVAIGGTPSQGDSFMNLLAKIVTQKGGTPRPGDNEWNLLVKWLETEGECMCNGMVIDFWRRILAASTLPEGPVLAAVVSEEAEASELAAYVGTHYLLVQQSPDGVNGWTTDQETPIDNNPLTVFLPGRGGLYVRAAVTTGNADPVTQWSNVVQVLS